MGALVTKALRPVKSFNIENRAHREISKEKPTAAPRYPGNIRDLQKTLETEPNIDDKLDKKDADLDNRLKEVYVTSFGRPEDDITREKRNKSMKRPLPMDRSILPMYEYGLKEPDKVTYGRTTLRDAINFIGAHQVDPKEVTATKIALEYKLKEEDVESILKYFKTYEAYLPATKTAPARYIGPASLRKQLYKEDLKQIESNKDEEQKYMVMKQRKFK